MNVLEKSKEQIYKFNPFSSNNIENTTFPAMIFFALLTIFLTFPILLRLDRLYLTAPIGEYVFDGTDHFYVSQKGFREYIDHVGHMNTLEEAVFQWQNGAAPVVIHPTYIVPLSYLLTGTLFLSVLPIETVIFHNMFFLLSMFLAGLSTFFFVREITENPNVALLAGALYMSSFFLFGEYLLGNTNQWQLQWIPLILYSVERVRDPANGRDVVLVSIAFVLQVISSTQYAVYLSFMLPLYIGLRYMSGAQEFRSRRFWGEFIAAGLLALLLLTPFLWTRLSVVGDTPTYSLAENAYTGYVLNNTIGAFFAADIFPHLGFRLTLLLGGGVGILVAGGRRRQLQIAPFLGLLVAGVVLARGPFEPWAPYAIFYQYWPLTEFYRTPYRMLPFALLGASVLSAGLLFPFMAGSGKNWSRQALVVTAGIIVLQVILVHELLQFTPYPL